MKTKENYIKILKELKPILKRDFSVSQIGIFGSFARNESKKDSDLDLLVQLSKPIGLKFCSLKLFLENKINRKIDLVTKKALKPKLKEIILNETVYL